MLLEIDLNTYITSLISKRRKTMTVKQLIEKLQKYPKNTVVQVGASYSWDYCQGNITDILPDKPRTEYRKSDIGKTCILLLADNNKELRR